jgi:hypothetical protein
VVEHVPGGAVVQQMTDRTGAPPDHHEIVLALVRFLAGAGWMDRRGARTAYRLSAASRPSGRRSRMARYARTIDRRPISRGRSFLLSARPVGVD